jgi:hypothetical protein
MKKGNRIKLTDESVNSLGTWVKTDGIDLTGFYKNPIMLYNHNEGGIGLQDEVLPIGTWSDIVLSSSEMTGIPNFSESYDFAKKVNNLYDEQVIRAASIGIVILETSDDPKLFKKGQTRPTITKCRLREISICHIPANKNAIVLYDAAGQLMNLSDKVEEVLPLIKLSDNQDKNFVMKKVLKHLKLNDSASEEDVVEKVEALEGEVGTLKKENAQLKEAEQKRKDTEIVSLLDTAVSSNKISATERPSYEKLLKLDFESTKTLIEARTPAVKLSDIPVKTGEALELKWNGETWKGLDKSGKLTQLKDQNFELFKQMYKGEYGKEYKA